MSNSYKRKREFLDAEEKDYESHYLLALDAHEAVVQPAALQQHVKLAGGRQVEANASGLIEWNSEGLEEAVLVDRYDARLLLEALPATGNSIIPDKPGEGWEDLPSDSEDLFFFSLDEADELRRRKKRRKIEDEREARLSALRAKEVEESKIENWGGSDEEPDETQMTLMKKTATHIASSPNPVQFEMRILANHGEDKRFAFLRGRWKRVWENLRESAINPPPKSILTAPSANGLVAYGDSDNDSAGSNDNVSQNIASSIIADDASIKAQRLARVKEWSRQRKEREARATQIE